MSCSDGGSIAGIPFEEWVAIPFPQPQFRNAPKLLADARVNRFALPACVIHVASPTERRRRIGLVPAGVVIVEASLPESTIVDLYHAATLAGPVLSRMAAVEEFRLSTNRLDQQREMLTAIVNSLPDPIVIINAAGNIVVQNRRAEHLLAFTDADSEGRRRAVEINNLLFTSHLSKAAIGGGLPETSGSRELNMVDPDEGTDLLFEVLTHELTASEGAHAGSTVSVLRDVTDLRRAANELERQVQRVRLAEIEAKRERDRLNLILENVADPILVTDDRSNIILMNKEAEQLFETPEEGDSWLRADAIRANDTKFTTFISDFTISPSLARREQMSLLIPESNIELPVEVVSGKILNRRGEPLAIVSVLHDLTEQVENERLYDELKTFSSQLEERIQAATADLAEQNTRLQWQSRELEKANRLKSEFLASMSHELRTPINALIGYASLMLDRIYGELTPRQEEGLNRIQGAAQHLLALINDILDLAKIEAGRMPLHLDDVSLKEVLTEITQQMEPLIQKEDCALVQRRAAAKGFDDAHRPDEGEADPAQPSLERGEVHAHRRRLAFREGPRRPGSPRGARHWNRNQGRRSRVDLGGFPAGGSVAHARVRRHRPRSQHHEETRGRTGREGRDAQRVRKGLDVRDHTSHSQSAPRRTRSPERRAGGRLTSATCRR